jgi:glycosyltransferase involved in cell wall biosynthesis
MLPRISVITPSFNQAQFLEDTIASVLAQNYPALEYIVIDGGSSDNSLEIIKRYERDIAFWVSEPDGGQSEAINKGLRRATGEIITWLNSDDVYLPNTLQTVAEYFDRPELALVHGKTILFGEGRREEVRGASEPDLRVQYLAKIPFPQPSSFFKRRVLLEQGYLDESLHYMMDYDLLVRIALNYELRSVPAVFSRYRLHEGCKTLTSPIAQAKAAARVFSKLLRSFDCTERVIRDIEELGLYVAGDDHYRFTKPYLSEEFRQAFSYFLESQAHLYYGDFDLDKTKLITEFVKRHDPSFYRSRNLNKLLRRSTILNKSTIRLLRAFTR